MTVLGRRGAADLLDGDLSVLIRLFYLLSANNSPVLDCIDNATLVSTFLCHTTTQTSCQTRSTVTRDQG